MALLKIWQVSRAIMRLLVIQFVCWLGCFSTFALAQFEISEGVTGSVTFPALGVTCLSNLAVFVTSLIRGRMDLEMGARDVLDILLSPKLQNIKRIKHGYGLTTCTQRNAAKEGGGDLPTASAEQVPQTASREESDVHAASTEQVPHTASREESDVHAASTAEITLQIDSTEGEVGSEGGGGGAAAAVEALEEGKEALKEAKEAVKEAIEAGGVAAAILAFKALIVAKEALREAVAAGEGVGGLTLEEAKEALKEGHAAAAETFARKQGLERAAVIMLSNDTANWSMKQFMKSNAYLVQSIVLPFLPLKRAFIDTKVREELTPRLSYECRCSTCHCIVFWTMEEITDMLATRMPATLKLLSNSLCLLPCSTCLRKGCHECDQENLLRAESEADEGQPMKQRVVSDILHKIRTGDILERKPIGICIPMNDAHSDAWTKLLLKSLRSKDAEGRGVTNLATEALQGYLGGGRGSQKGSVEYDIFSFVVPRLTEVLINLVLTFWFRVDAFSSALLARRTVRDYLVDTKSSGFAANAFLTEAVVKSNADNSQVCQVLAFRGRHWLWFITFISVGCVNVICALGWSLLISFEGGPDTSQPPSLPTVAVIIAAVGLPWVVLSPTMMGAHWETSYDIRRLLRIPGRLFRELSLDIRTVPLTLHDTTVPLYFLRTGWWFVRVFVLVLLILVIVVISPVLWPGFLVPKVLKQLRNLPYAYPLITTGLYFEMACLVSWSALAGALGIKGFGRWLYAALQILIWLKWATGSYLLNQENLLKQENSLEFFGIMPTRMKLIMYSSAFWLNAVLAGVRCKWEAWPWKHNHLF